MQARLDVNKIGSYESPSFLLLSACCLLLSCTSSCQNKLTVLRNSVTSCDIRCCSPSLRLLSGNLSVEFLTLIMPLSIVESHTRFLQSLLAHHHTALFVIAQCCKSDRTTAVIYSLLTHQLQTQKQRGASMGQLVHYPADCNRTESHCFEYTSNSFIWGFHAAF